MGEENFAQTALVKAVQGVIAEQPQPSSDLRVATPGGVFQVRWDDNASASALGQLAFFAEFLVKLLAATHPGNGVTYLTSIAPDNGCRCVFQESC